MYVCHVLKSEAVTIKLLFIYLILQCLKCVLIGVVRPTLKLTLSGSSYMHMSVTSSILESGHIVICTLANSLLRSMFLAGFETGAQQFNNCVVKNRHPITILYSILSEWVVI